jgi:hypothetical protein
MIKSAIVHPGDVVQLKRLGTWKVDAIEDGYVTLSRIVHGSRSTTSRNVRTKSSVEYWKIREERVWA